MRSLTGARVSSCANMYLCCRVFVVCCRGGMMIKVKTLTGDATLWDKGWGACLPT